MLIGRADLAAGAARRVPGIGEVEQEQENIERIEPREPRHEESAHSAGASDRRVVIIMDDET